MNNQERLTTADILNLAHPELTSIALQCGIDWGKVIPLLSNTKQSLKHRIESERKYKGSVNLLFDTHTAKNGQEYPVITFLCKKHGELKETFNGYQFLVENELIGGSDNFVKPITTSLNYPPITPHKITKNCQCCGIQYEPAHHWASECSDCYGVNRFNALHNNFNTLKNADINHPYLNNKGFIADNIPTGFLKQDSDYKGTFIVFRLQNIEGNTIGYQKIYADGLKNFVFYYYKDKDGNQSTLKKGSFALLGGTIQDVINKGAYFCEGMASGLTCHIATNSPVVICLDAGNLPIVIKTLTKAGCTKKYIACDNDINQKDNGNIGIHTAIKAAKDHGARVFVPTLDGNQSIKCDFDDLRQKKGTEAVKKQLKTRNNLNEIKKPFNNLDLIQYAPRQQLKQLAITIAMELAKQDISTDISHDLALLKTELDKRDFPFNAKKLIKNYRQKQQNFIKETNFITEFLRINQMGFNKQTNNDIARHLLTNKGLWIDNRGIGAGKTHLMSVISDYAKSLDINDNQVTAITHRVSLVKGISDRLELKYYNDIFIDQNHHEQPQTLAVCINSIVKHDVANNVNILFIDEFRQTLEHLLNGVVDNRFLVYQEFISAINNADLVLCSDADFNNACVDWLDKNCNKPINQVVQDPEPMIEKTIHLLGKNYKTPHHENITLIFKALESGKNCLVATDSKNQAKTTETYLISQGIDKESILLLTGENKGDKKQADFLANPNAEAEKYQCVIYSPVISSGVSIDVNHFHQVHALFSGVLPENELIQSIGRCRPATEFYISMAEVMNSYRPTNIQHLIDGEIMKRARYQDGALTLADIDILILENRISINQSLNDYKNRFLLLAELKGYKITLPKAKGTTIKGLAKAVKEQEINRIATAEEIDTHTAEKLEKTAILTQQQTDSLDKHQATTMTGKNNLNNEDIECYLNEGRTKLLNFELVQMDENDLVSIKNTDKLNLETRTKNNSLSSKAFIFKQMVHIFGEQKFNHIDADVGCQILRGHHKELSANGLGNYNKFSKYPIRTLKTFFKNIGYDLALESRERNKGNPVRFYSLKPNKLIQEYAQTKKLNQQTFIEEKSI